MSEPFDIPIFHQTYQLYKELYLARANVPKQDRYALWQKVETITLDMVEGILSAASAPYKEEKIEILKIVSNNLNLLRVLLRLSKDVRTIDSKKYVGLEGRLNEIGKMLGGWMKSSKSI